MLDMHNHIIYGVDDGCKTIEDSIGLIEKAISVGVTDIIMTSHYAKLRGYVASNDEIITKFNEIQKVVKEKKLKVNLYLGREIDYFPGMDEIIDQGIIETLNGTNYVLVDFGMKKTDIDEAIYNLIIAGYKPIIAHPERYNYVNDYNLYHKWKQTGALLQINATSLFHPKNKTVKKITKYLIKNNLVDFVGSDTHSKQRNFDDFAKAYKKINNDFKLAKNHRKLLKTEKQMRKHRYQDIIQ
jgi:protein-tyrosine phosphatase